MHAECQGSRRSLVTRCKTAIYSILGFWAKAVLVARPIPLLCVVRAVAPRHSSNGLRLLGALLVTAFVSLISGCAGGWQGSTSANSSQTSITQPQSQTVNIGQTATFSVTATGAGPFSYQWYENGQPISGANSGTYTVMNPSMTDSGAVFTVTVTGAGGTVTSSPATLTVKAVPPTITTQPVSQTVLAGDTATRLRPATAGAYTRLRLQIRRGWQPVLPRL